MRSTKKKTKKAKKRSIRFSSLARCVSKAIHSRTATRVSGTPWYLPVRRMPDGIRYVDVDLKGYDDTFRFFEQDENGHSKAHYLVERGHRITWIMSLPSYRTESCGVVNFKFTKNLYETIEEMWSRELYAETSKH